MPIFQDSRYRTARALATDIERSGVERKGIKFLYTRERLSENVPVDQTYVTQLGDRLDTLAFKFGGDSRLWWVIADMNNIISFPLFIDSGTKLRIPARSVFQEIGGVA
jgi:nucleoid-associated protein YgaU